MMGQSANATPLLDLSHAEAYTVIVFGLLSGIYLASSRPRWLCGAAAHEAGCGATTLRAVGGGIVPAAVLFSFRAAVGLYCLAIYALHVLAKGVIINRFYTVWNWVILTLYFAVAARESWLLMRLKSGAPPFVDTLGQASVVLFHICLTNAMLIDTVTWSILVPMLTTYNKDPEQAVHFTEVFFSFISYNQHGANLAFILIELALNSTPFFAHMLGYVQVTSCVFGIWANVYFSLFGSWLYPFLDTSKPWAWEAYLALFAAHWLFYFVAYLLHRTKKRAHAALGVASGKDCCTTTSSKSN